MPVTFDHLYTYAELTDALEAFAAARPDLVTIESIGRSHEGRDIWLATVTNSATAAHNEKPAIWVGANIHSVEHTGAVAALHLIHRLVDGHGHDAGVTHALDTRTFYVVPRINPDGAELALATPPQYLRSSTRRWPRTDDAPGLVEGDVDGDGRILSMRVEDPNGPWVACTRDPRLLVARAPDDFGAGPYYRLLLRDPRSRRAHNSDRARTALARPQPPVPGAVARPRRTTRRRAGTPQRA